MAHHRYYIQKLAMGRDTYCRNKFIYESRADAKRAARLLEPSNRTVQAYRCPHNPTWWHIGHRTLEKVGRK
jgi:hypothetical protein